MQNVKKVISNPNLRGVKVPEIDLMKRLLVTRSIAKTTGGGKMRNVWCMVVVGDTHGSAGYGEGRSPDGANAVAKATALAIKNMIYIDRFDNRTTYSDFTHTYQHVTLDIKSCAAGHGIIANNYIHEVCRCFGVNDIAVKIRGSTNPMNVVKAIFDALTSQSTPKEIAQNRGMKISNVLNKYYGDDTDR